MEEIIEHLRETGFLQPHSLDRTELENLILKPSQDRIDLIKWCFSEVDVKLGTKLENARGDEIKQQLRTLTRKLGLTSRNNGDAVLGFGDQEQQLQFWLELLKVVKCVQVRNNLSTEQRLKQNSNTSNLWCEHLQNPKYKESLNTKLNLIPTEWRIGTQQEPALLTSIVQDKESLLQQLQLMKEESRDSLYNTGSLGKSDINNLSSADLKALAVNTAEMAARLNLESRDELKSKPRHRHHQAENKEAKAVEETFQSVYRQVDTLSQTVNVAETVVDGFEAVAGLHCENKLGVGGKTERLQNEMLECLSIVEGK